MRAKRATFTFWVDKSSSKIVHFDESWQPELFGQTVYPEGLLFIGETLVESAKNEKFKCDILGNFQTLWERKCPNSLKSGLEDSRVPIYGSHTTNFCRRCSSFVRYWKRPCLLKKLADFKLYRCCCSSSEFMIYFWPCPCQKWRVNSSIVASQKRFRVINLPLTVSSQSCHAKAIIKSHKWDGELHFQDL